LNTLNSIDRKSLKFRCNKYSIKEKKNGDLKTIGLFSKKARGLMSKFIIQNKIKNPVDLKNFNDDGYKFNAKYSDDNNFLFIR
jgi:Uncharacterized protein conserved in bacteria